MKKIFEKTNRPYTDMAEFIVVHTWAAEVAYAGPETLLRAAAAFKYYIVNFTFIKLYPPLLPQMMYIS